MKSKSGYYVAGAVLGGALLLNLTVPPLERIPINSLGPKEQAQQEFIKPRVERRPHPACGFHEDGTHKMGVVYCVDIVTFLGVLHQCNFIRCAGEQP